MGGINDSGAVVGGWALANTTYIEYDNPGFLDQGGQFSAINILPAILANNQSVVEEYWDNAEINNSGTIVGTFTDEATGNYVDRHRGLLIKMAKLRLWMIQMIQHHMLLGYAELYHSHNSDKQ